MNLLKIIVLAAGMCMMSACPPASANQNHHVAMAWQGLCPCQIWRSTNGTNFSVISTVNANTYQDNNVTPNKTYWYFVSNTKGNSNVVKATIP